jgi:hypothetical protein
MRNKEQNRKIIYRKKLTKLFLKLDKEQNPVYKIMIQEKIKFYKKQLIKAYLK